MKHQEIANFISDWLKAYTLNAKMNGFVVGISGGIDSALTSSLCALTGLDVLCLNMPIHQRKEEFDLAEAHIENLKSRFSNVRSMIIDLTETFETFKTTLPDDSSEHALSMANTRSRLRMLTLYALGQNHNLLVAGTGNKVEDFGIGFYTKYGDGGVDISPIADLNKTEVTELGKFLGVIDEIVQAAPTDGLWGDGRTDEDQIGASYAELEWAMEFQGDEHHLSSRNLEVLQIYRRFHTANKHKMIPIPVCTIPTNLK